MEADFYKAQAGSKLSARSTVCTYKVERRSFYSGCDVAPLGLKNNLTRAEAALLARARQLFPYRKIRQAKAGDVLYEGELLKYKPGLKISYIERWGQITKNEFRYFKNNWTANCWLSRPLQHIPFRTMA